MRKITILLLLSFIPIAATAQDLSYQGRGIIGADVEIVDGLKLNGSFEARSDDFLKNISRYDIEFVLDYKFNKWLKVGAIYESVNKYNSERVKKSMNRYGARVALSHKFGDWDFTLRETAYLYNKLYDVNLFQEPQNDVVLKSRFKVSYKGFETIEPYGYVEFRHNLNTVSYNTDGDGSFEFIDYGYTYMSRIRYSAGLEWSVTKRSTFDFSLLADNVQNRDLDVNKKGTKLKSIDESKSTKLVLKVCYCYSFGKIF